MFLGLTRHYKPDKRPGVEQPGIWTSTLWCPYKLYEKFYAAYKLQRGVGLQNVQYGC